MKRRYFREYNYEDLAYLAGVLDYRGHFCVENGMLLVSLRLPGKLPEQLKERFGGCCFVNGIPKRNWYKVRGQKAAELLGLVLPHLIHQAAWVRKLLAGEKPMKSGPK